MLRDLRRTRVLLGVLLIASFVLVTLDYRTGRGSPLDGVRAVAAGVLGPVQAGVAAVTRPVARTVSGIGRAGATTARADRLARDNAALREQLALARRGPATSLDRLLGLAAAGRYRIVPARLVALGGGLGFSWTATIDAGRRDGLRPDLTVVSGRGLVGRVKTVTTRTATVLLAADPASKVGVRVSASGEIGVITGQATGPLVLELLDAHARVRVGEAVTTFGSPGGRPYAAGVPVGRVGKVFAGPGTATRTALVTPYVRFSSLDLVGVVIAAPQPAIRRATLPPKPDPVVRPTVPKPR